MRGVDISPHMINTYHKGCKMKFTALLLLVVTNFFGSLSAQIFDLNFQYSPGRVYHYQQQIDMKSEVTFLVESRINALKGTVNTSFQPHEFTKTGLPFTYKVESCDLVASTSQEESKLDLKSFQHPYEFSLDSSCKIRNTDSLLERFSSENQIVVLMTTRIFPTFCGAARLKGDRWTIQSIDSSDKNKIRDVETTFEFIDLVDYITEPCVKINYSLVAKSHGESTMGNMEVKFNATENFTGSVLFSQRRKIILTNEYTGNITELLNPVLNELLTVKRNTKIELKAVLLE